MKVYVIKNWDDGDHCFIPKGTLLRPFYNEGDYYVGVLHAGYLGNYTMDYKVHKDYCEVLEE